MKSFKDFMLNESISERQFSVAISSADVRRLITAAAGEIRGDSIIAKTWEKGGKVRLYLSMKGARRNTDMGFLTVENGAIVLENSGWANMATQSIIASATRIINANAAPDGAKVASRNAHDTGTNVEITTYDAAGRLIAKRMAD